MTNMYAVIFKAKINKRDKAYSEMAVKMRELAMDKYSCADFVSVTEGNLEISISYWSNMNDITSWKQNSEHLAAQELGASAWYSEYQVQVVEIIREYEKQL